jgi:hypothetical protein
VSGALRRERDLTAARPTPGGAMTDYDSPWKNALKRYFPDFLAFFFPAAHAGIDWTKGYTMLDKELQKAVRDATLGRRWADSLVRVTARDGKEDWILAHVEIQGQNQPDFPKRMFVYNYRIYDVHDRPVVSLTVLADPFSAGFGEFAYERWGCRMGLRYPVVSLGAYRKDLAALEASPNPFAVITQAHLQAQDTADSDTARYRAKLALIRSLYRRGYQRADILELLRFIDWVLTLPAGLEDQLWTEIQNFEEERRMHYLASFERVAQKEGIAQGRPMRSCCRAACCIASSRGSLPNLPSLPRWSVIAEAKRWKNAR